MQKEKERKKGLSGGEGTFCDLRAQITAWADWDVVARGTCSAP